MAVSTLESIRKGQFELDLSDRSPTVIGLIIVTLTFGLFGTWSFTAPLDSAALAPGEVTVESYRKTVQHLEGGIIERLLVRDGDYVEKNQPLIEMDATLVSAELGITLGQIYSLEAALARLKAERDALSSVEYPSSIPTSDPRAFEAIRNEQAVFKARMNSREGEVQVLQQRVAQADEQIRGFEELIKSRTTLLRSLEEEVSELRELLKEGFVDIQRIRELERRASDVRSQVAEFNSSISQARVRRSETELQILLLQKDFQTEVVDQLTQVESKLLDLRERQRALEARSQRAIIRAPESGMVIGLKVHTEGGVVQAGAPILEIVPDGSELIIEAQVSPIDIDRVSKGVIADVRFSAFKQATTPVVEGTVTHISADRLVNQETGLPYYLAKIKISEEELKRLGDLELLPGMPAEVLINTGARTFFDYLVQPATNAFARSLIED